MFKYKNKQFLVTRTEEGAFYFSKKGLTFQAGDTLEFRIYEKDGLDSSPVKSKSFPITEATEKVRIELLSGETDFGTPSNEPEEYWYEIELNPDTPDTNTIIGYDQKKGAPLFVLLPEGGKKNDNG